MSTLFRRAVVSIVAMVTAGLAAAGREAELIAILGCEASLKEKVDACRELGRIGGPAAVPALAALLRHPELAHMSRAALEAIPHDAVLGALRAALPASPAPLRAGLADSLGFRRDVRAVPLLADLLKDPYPVVAGAAARALGRIGGADAALRTASVPVRSDIAEGLLRCAGAMESGPDRRAAYERLRANDVPPAARAAALRGLILAKGTDGVGDIVSALSGTDPFDYTVAFRAAQELPGADATRPLAEAIPTLSGPARADLIHALGTRADSAAAEALVREARTAPDKPLRLAALAALGRIGAGAATPALVDLARDADPEIAEAARSVLAVLPDEAADRAIESLFANSGDPALRVAALELLVRRARPDLQRTLRTLLDDRDEPVRLAALRVLRASATPEDLPVLLGRLLKAGPGAESEALGAALAALAGREARATAGRVEVVRTVYGLPDGGPSVDVTAAVAARLKSADAVIADNQLAGDPAPGRQKRMAVTFKADGTEVTQEYREGEVITPPLVAADPPSLAPLYTALPSAAPHVRLALLRALAATGEPKALEAVRGVVSDGDPAVRAAGARLLRDWPTPPALPILAELARSSSDPAIRRLALRGALRLLPFVPAQPAGRWTLFAALEGLLANDEDRKAALATLAGIPVRPALERAAQWMDVPALRAEAAAAVRIAERLGPEHAAEVSAAMKKACEAATDAPTRRRAAALIRAPSKALQ